MNADLTPRQIDVLRAIDAGHVTDRLCRRYWVSHRTDTIGREADVSAVTQQLRSRGLAVCGAPNADGVKPWRLTVDGRLTLAATVARARQRGEAP